MWLAGGEKQTALSELRVSDVVRGCALQLCGAKGFPRADPRAHRLGSHPTVSRPGVVVGGGELSALEIVLGYASPDGLLLRTFCDTRSVYLNPRLSRGGVAFKG